MLKLKTPEEIQNSYSPLYFLSALGAGGLSISFFLYLMFWLPHPNTPIPTFSDVSAYFSQAWQWQHIVFLVAMAAMLVLAAMFVRMLVWNLKAYKLFQQTEAYTQLKQSNAETQRFAIPLTLAMGVNVSLALGAVFIPGLWSIVEYLFPIAIAAFTIIGYFAARMYLDFFARVMATGGFDCTKNNNLGQALPAFAFSMVAVGLAASVAMSTNPLTQTIALVLSIVFFVAALVLTILKVVFGMRAMFEHGAAVEGLPTFLVIIPIVTLLGISVIRWQHGLHSFEAFGHSAPITVWLTALIALQLMFGALGLAMKKRMNYFSTYVAGEKKSPASLALICPGVALVVLGMFWINKGLVPMLPEELAKFGIAYMLLYVPFIYLQLRTLTLYFKLGNKLLGKEPVGLQAA